AKQAEKEAQKQAKAAEKEAGKQAKLDEQATREAEGEIRRMRLYDESVSAAAAASEEVEAMISVGDYSGAIGKLRAQQNAVGQSVKYLPETPESVQTRANVAEVVEGINNWIPELRRQALDARSGAFKADATQEQRGKAEAGQRIADGYREKADRKRSQGDLL